MILTGQMFYHYRIWPLNDMEGLVEDTARNIMVREFQTISPDKSIADAVRIFKEIGGPESHRRLFGMMVTDETGKLIGMISMYDILLLMRPKHIHIWADMKDIDVTGLIDITCERAKSILVGDITIRPETHLFVILDTMIKKHIRRIPVMEGERIAGIVYISDLFYYIYQKLGQ